MKVLITGATGLIGQAIVKELHKKGSTVNYLTTSKNKIVEKDNYKGYYWNPPTGEIDTNCFKDVTSIINLAGASIAKKWTPSYKATILNSRVESLQTLKKGLEIYETDAITSFVSASAIGIYPNSKSVFYTEEESKVDSSFLGSVVDAWEKEINSFNAFGFNLATIRIGIVLSNDGGALSQMAKPIRNYIGAAFGSGEQWQSWIHIKDMAKMFVFASTHKLKGTFNGVAPNPVNNTKLTKEIAKVLERPIFLPNIPEFVMKAVLGEMAYLLFASQRVSSKKIETEGFKYNYNTICRALEEIYAKPKPKSESYSYTKEDV